MSAPARIVPAALLLAALLAAPAAGAPRLATRVQQPSRLTVGDRFELTLTLDAPASSRAVGPLADSLGVFLVTGAKSDGNVHHLTLAAFRAGRQRLPVFTFLVRTGARVDTLRSDTATVTITSVLPRDMKDIHDLKAPESFPNVWLWAIPAIVLLLAALAWAAWRLGKRLRRIREEATRPLPPWEEALAALDAMPWQDWLDAGLVKRYYYALSQVLKRYIERRFEFNAVEQTTTEILSSMRAHRTPMRDEVRAFLLRSDFVKYARTVPPDEEMRSAMAEVRDFVTRTRPAEPAAVAPATTAPAAPAEGRA